MKLFEVFDFETVTENNIQKPLILAWTDNNITHTRFLKNLNADSALEIILLNFKQNVIYYAHNLIFDFSLIFKSILKKKIPFKWNFINYKLFRIRLMLHNKQIELRCSYKLIPYALKQFYPIFSKYEKIIFPYNCLQNWNSNDIINIKVDNIVKAMTAAKAIKLYVIRDCLILKEGLVYYWNNLNKLNYKLNENSLSSGGISLQLLEKSNSYKINFNLKNEIIINLKEAYRGGRCEIFGNPNNSEKILHFDFAGMYHSCMFDDFPTETFDFIEKPLNFDKPGFYFIEIEYYNILPILPIKTTKLFFPEGKIKGLFWYEEILLAIEYSSIKYLNIKYAFISTCQKKCLLNLANNLKNLNIVNLNNKITKILANSLYGRLGLTESMSVTTLKYNNNILENIDINGVQLQDHMILKSKPKSNIAIAAVITSRARIKLYKAFQSLNKLGGRPLYCDTDSIIWAFPKTLQVEDKWIDNIFFDTKKPDTIIQDAVFIAPKTYALLYNNMQVIKLKGINASEENFQDLKKAFFLEEVLILKRQSLLRKNSFEYELSIDNLKIDLNQYDKRLFNNTKLYTKPIIYNMF